MLLFFSPVFNFLSKSEKQAKLVYWGVELIPANDANKSLQVAGDFHHKLLTYIKHHIDAAIAEMEEQQEQAIAKPLELSDNELQQAAAEAKADIVPEPDLTLTPNTTKNTTELKSESLKKQMLECKSKQQLEEFKAKIGSEKASEIWDSLSIIEKNHIKVINLHTDPNKNKQVISVGVLLKYTDNNGNTYNARGIGHYLYGKALKDNERAILVDGELQPIIVKRSQLKPFKAKDQKSLDDKELELLQNFLTQPQQHGDEYPDPAEIAALNLTGLAPSPKPQIGS